MIMQKFALFLTILILLIFYATMTEILLINNLAKTYKILLKGSCGVSPQRGDRKNAIGGLERGGRLPPFTNDE
jgi:hypothetical protein